ncbi:unnamed protein product [Prorocentrum cordatum]|uniref:Exostosin GT47 domain-containing protein n=1 Tax=Prorocentrum cordatum TaxID=2364126 RepID=A0ABN9VBW0_9DINO|nr:unnamed protein product [Polarella glacialis]
MIYEELGVLASGLAFCKDNQWGFEVLLHLYFLACDCRTDDPTEADFFFVPQYTACHLNLKTFSEEESNALFESLIPKLKHFKRSDGRDHVFVWGAGFAVDGPFQNWRSYIQRSIFLMTETEFWNPYKWQIRSNYNAAKDIVLPGRLSIREIKQHHENAVPMGMRAYVGDFVGWNRPLHHSQGTAESPRQRLLKWAARFPDMHIRQDVPYAEALEGSVNSRFCFVPRGKSAWSSRMFRVLFGGCVPVLLNDDYELPFQALLGSAEEWLIRWPMREVTDELADTLRRLDTKTLEQMVRHAREPRCWYVWPPPTVDASHWELEDGDLDAICPEWRTKNAFVATMALLAPKRRTTKASFKTFYAPRGPGEGRHFVDAQRNPV